MGEGDLAPSQGAARFVGESGSCRPDPDRPVKGLPPEATRVPTRTPPAANIAARTGPILEPIARALTGSSSRKP